MDGLKRKIKYWLKAIIEFVLNPRFLLCFGLAWMITNGWAYAATALGLWFGLDWLWGIGAAYLTALWIPFTPEKIITVIIAIFLLKLLFPNDKKTLERLHNMRTRVISEAKKIHNNRKLKKQLKLQNKKRQQMLNRKSRRKQKNRRSVQKNSRRKNR